MSGIDFDRAPFLLIWEVTRGCALACQHCRAEAIDWRDPNELTTDEGRKLMDEVREMGTRILVLTGGDPLQRDDLEDLIRHGKSIDLRVGTIPATTPRLTADRVAALQAAGLDQMAISLDGSTAASHDGFRQVPGCFDKAMEAAQFARAANLPLQVNTVFASWNFDDFDALAALVEELGVVFWEVFFLVPVGRGTVLDGCTAEQYDALFEKLLTLSRRVDFVIKVTEAPHYRAYVARAEEAGAAPARLKPATEGARGGHPGGGHPGGGHPTGMVMTKAGVNSGKGFCFVDHIGDVQPSGFLPLTAGNVRDTSVTELYRDSPLFRDLRDTSKLKGVCGMCRFRDTCGGSRARAYALTGDYHAEEEFCVYGQQLRAAAPA
jgi:radical SAM protein